MTRKKREFNIFEKDNTKETISKSNVDYIEESQSTNNKKESSYIRHTFIIDPADLKILQSVVHKIKSSGNYEYTQKLALKEAIELLNKKHN